ncbi:MAG: MATE family efflux transporter [Pseudomonadota bacterium]
MTQTDDSATDEPITYTRVCAIALPVMLSNATVPLQGAIDTAIIGNLGSEVFLAAVALGAALFALYTGMFNFLHMSTSGLTAQALGAGVPRRVINTLIRGLIVAGVIAVVLFALQNPLTRLGLALFEGSAEAESLAATYFQIRAIGFPAELANYALIGWFAGQELTRRLLEMQLIISVLNIMFNVFFVLGLGWGVEGVAIGTVLASYCGLALGLWRAWSRGRMIAPKDWQVDWRRLLDRTELTQVMSLNRDLFVRSLLLVICFTWITRLGSLQGDTVLAANGILILFLHISAYALDGFAIAAETLVGQALGAGSLERLRRSVIVSSTAAVVLALVFSILASLAARQLVNLFTNVEEVREVAMQYVLWATFMPLFGVLAFQMDGIFVGAAEGAGMRNAMIASAAIFLPLSWVMTDALGNHGLWAATALLLLLRAAFLGFLYPALEKRARCSASAGAAT